MNSIKWNYSKLLVFNSETSTYDEKGPKFKVEENWDSLVKNKICLLVTLKKIEIS